MIGNAHLDPVWLWPWQEGYQEARATFASVLDRMDEYPDFVFTCDQIVLLSWVEEVDPELFERIRQRVIEGRWVNTGGWWVEPDCNMPAGESFVRQGLVGQRFLRRAFGSSATVGMNVDPFGHNASIPQILRGQGMDAYCFMRPGPHENDLPTLFWWQSPDGSRVLAYQIPFAYGSEGGELGRHTDYAVGISDQEIGDLMVFYGVGNHGGGPTRANINSIQRHDVMGTYGRLELSSPPEYFARLQATYGQDGLDRLPVVTGDLQHHAPGCYSAQSMIKIEQRRAQHVLLAAERWAVTASAIAGMAYPSKEFGHAWEQVLFNQFHDILPGSAIEPSYVDARDQLGEAVAISKRALTQAHNRIAGRVNVPFEEGTYPLVVFNPHPWQVTADLPMQYTGSLGGEARVVDHTGAEVPSQVIRPVAATTFRGGHAVLIRSTVPSLGYRLLRIVRGAPGWPADAPEPVVVNGTTLSNGIVSVTIDEGTGLVGALRVEDGGFDPLAGAAGPHLVVSQDPTDTWGHRVVSYAGPGVPMERTSVVVDERGPLRASIRVTFAWGRSVLTEVYSLAAGADQVRVDVELDWREAEHLLKLRWPVGIEDPEAQVEIPFAHLVRTINGSEEPGQSWIDLSGPEGGLTIINDAKHAYDVSPAEADSRTVSVGITAVRSPIYSWHDPLVLDDPEAYVHQDQGLQRFSVLLQPHTGPLDAADAARRAQELGQRQRAMMEGSHPGELPPVNGFLACSSDRVLVSALKRAEDGDAVVVRAVERAGLPAPDVSIELPFLSRTIATTFGPFQIRTFRIPADGGPIEETDLLEDPLADR